MKEVGSSSCESSWSSLLTFPSSMTPSMCRTYRICQRIQPRFTLPSSFHYKPFISHSDIIHPRRTMATAECPNGAVPDPDPRPVFFFDIDNCVCICISPDLSLSSNKAQADMESCAALFSRSAAPLTRALRRGLTWPAQHATSMMRCRN